MKVEDGWKMGKDSRKIKCKGRNVFNDRDELEALAIAIKEVCFQDYRTAYSHDEDDSHIEIDKSHFEHLIWIDNWYLEI